MIISAESGTSPLSSMCLATLHKASCRAEMIMVGHRTSRSAGRSSMRVTCSAS